MAVHPAKDINEHVTASRDLAHLFVGSWLGGGMTRQVYTVEHDPTLVIKFENEGDHFQNIMEWRIWQEIKDFPAYAKWLAPCVAISPNGIWLLQKRAVTVPKDKYPKKLPDFLGDTKLLNFGRIGKRFVACDYGTPSIGRFFWKSRHMVKAKWWGEEH